MTSLWYSLLKYQDVSVRFASHRHYSHLQSITWLAGNSQREKVKIFNCYLCHTISFCFIFQAFFIWHSTENATEHCFIISFLFPFDTFFFYESLYILLQYVILILCSLLKTLCCVFLSSLKGGGRLWHIFNIINNSQSPKKSALNCQVSVCNIYYFQSSFKSWCCQEKSSFHISRIVILQWVNCYAILLCLLQFYP